MQHHSLKRRFRAAMVAALGEIAAIASPEFVTDHIDRLAAQIQPIANGNNLAQINYNLASIATNSQEKELITTWTTIAITLSHHQELAALPTFLSGYGAKNLGQQSRQGSYERITGLETLVLGWAIALCCRDQFNPRNFVSNCCQYLGNQLDHIAAQNDLAGAGESETIAADILVGKLWQQLQLVQKLVNQGQSGLVARSLLGANSLNFGLYCFLSTPEHGQLVNCRLAQFMDKAEAIESEGSSESSLLDLKTQPKLNPRVGIALLTAVYNGLIPDINNDQILRSGIELGDRLLAYWSGIFEPELKQPDFYPAITAADVLGRRR